MRLKLLSEMKVNNLVRKIKKEIKTLKDNDYFGWHTSGFYINDLWVLSELRAIKKRLRDRKYTIKITKSYLGYEIEIKKRKRQSNGNGTRRQTKTPRW